MRQSELAHEQHNGRASERHRMHVYLVRPSRAPAARRAAARPGRRGSTAPFAARCHGCCALVCRNSRSAANAPSCLPGYRRQLAQISGLGCRGAVTRRVGLGGGAGAVDVLRRCLQARQWQGCSCRASRRVHDRGALGFARRQPPKPGAVSRATAPRAALGSREPGLMSPIWACPAQHGLQGTWPDVARVGRHHVTSIGMISAPDRARGQAFKRSPSRAR